MPSFAWIESLLRKALPDKFALFNTTNTAKTSGLWQRRALSTKNNQAFPDQRCSSGRYAHTWGTRRASCRG